MSDVEEDSYEENTFDTDVEEDGDVEELANMLSKLQPYQYEPCNRERKSDGSESETTDNDSDTESDGLDPIEINCEGTEQNIKELKTKKNDSRRKSWLVWVFTMSEWDKRNWLFMLPRSGRTEWKIWWKFNDMHNRINWATNTLFEYGSFEKRVDRASRCKRRSSGECML